MTKDFLPPLTTPISFGGFQGVWVALWPRTSILYECLLQAYKNTGTI